MRHSMRSKRPGHNGSGCPDATARRSGFQVSRPVPESPGRSRIMRAIRGSGNRTTELRFAAGLRSAGISGWRRHQALLGRPDFVWRKERLAVFVDGCFWHGCPRCYQAPLHNSRYWREKLMRNRLRDSLVTRGLRADGYTVMRIWECAVTAPRSYRRVRRVLKMSRASFFRQVE